MVIVCRCGKTTLCQLFAALLGRKLLSINCHMHTEAADFLGGLKPTRNRSSTDVRLHISTQSGSLEHGGSVDYGCSVESSVIVIIHFSVNFYLRFFPLFSGCLCPCQSGQGGKASGLFEWQDGVVVQAMQDGCCLLVDEISLAEDAVLERLNSVLERERRLLVSERSRGQGEGEVFQITAAEGFTFMATMNPGGDYGKKEVCVDTCIFIWMFMYLSSISPVHCQ